jgi:hypothetical protein
MSQQQDLEAIDDFIERTEPVTALANQLRFQWFSWFSRLSLYESTFDSSVLATAKRKRQEFIQANTPAVEPPGESLIEKVKTVMATKGKAPANVPMPAGYRRLTVAETTPAVTEFAKQALLSALPIGKRQAQIIGGKLVEAITEWHYDNHVPNKLAPGEPFWHPGISMITPSKQLPRPAAKKAPVAGPQVLAYDPLTRPGSTDLASLMEQADSKVV